ncbi:hypothetical protein SLA2020_204510 [Shorea laevis]
MLSFISTSICLPKHRPLGEDIFILDKGLVGLVYVQETLNTMGPLAGEKLSYLNTLLPQRSFTSNFRAETGK